MNPRSPEACNKRGLVWSKKGDYDRAIADFSKALALNPGYDEAYFNRGFAWDQKGNVREALSDVQKALSLKPHDTTYRKVMSALEGQLRGKKP
jgi:tetratricopeptide (TPR) repeat protein